MGVVVSLMEVQGVSAPVQPHTTINSTIPALVVVVMVVDVAINTC